MPRKKAGAEQQHLGRFEASMRPGHCAPEKAAAQTSIENAIAGALQ